MGGWAQEASSTNGVDVDQRERHLHTPHADSHFSPSPSCQMGGIGCCVVLVPLS